MIVLPDKPRSKLVRKLCKLGALATEGAYPFVGFDGRIEPYRIIIKGSYCWLWEREEADGSFPYERWRPLKHWAVVTEECRKFILKTVTERR
jgi:hypothetical protein